MVFSPQFLSCNMKSTELILLENNVFLNGFNSEFFKE